MTDAVAASAGRPFLRRLEIRRRSLRFALFALIGVGAALGGSLFHRAAAKGDVVKFDLPVPAYFPAPAELDLAARAWPRRLLAGDVAAFAVRMRAQTPIALRLAVEGDAPDLRLVVDGDDHAEDRVVRLAPKRRTTLSVSFVVPAQRRGAATPAEVVLLLEEEGTRRPLGRVPLRVVDTAHGGVLSASAAGRSGHGAHSGH